MTTTSTGNLFRSSTKERSQNFVHQSIRFAGSELEVSEVFDTYWRFAAERQTIFFKRLQHDFPLTTDPILSIFKFTNAYRASDRVSQYLIRDIAYHGEQTEEEIFFRIILFKLFNKIETWELLRNTFGEVCYSEFRLDLYDRVLDQAMSKNLRIYSAAYIMPSGGLRATGRKHVSHLGLLERMMKDGVPAKIAGMRKMEDAFLLLRSYPMIGDFLAFQFVTDLNYSRLTSFDEMDFVVAGPGARDGLRKCFPNADLRRSSDIIRFVTDIQQEQFDRLGISFPSLWGRRLQLIDCQNLFCEVDKYSRRAHPHIKGTSGRTRIKQQFTPNHDPLKLFYPPKWKINERISAEHQAQ
jgi:alpha-glutamyl/putrescinyl thymine pyrophosphorylase clade 1